PAARGSTPWTSTSRSRRSFPRRRRWRGSSWAAREPRVDDEEAPVPLPLDGRLDLHLFHPRDVPALLDAYLPECRAAGVLQLEIVHGKGTGALGRRVRALLDRREDVLRYSVADESRGGWGVTLVTLQPLPGDCGTHPSPDRPESE